MSDPWEDFAGPAAVADPEPADAPWHDFTPAEETDGPWAEFGEVPQAEVPRGTPRSTARQDLAKRLTDARLFGSATAALQGAADKGIRRKPDGDWDLPLMEPAVEGDFIDEFVGGISGAATVLRQKTGARLDDASDSVIDKKSVQQIFHDFQQANNLSDEEVQSVWSDLGNQNRTWGEDEAVRVLSDGDLLPNPNSSVWLDPAKAEAAIAASPAPEESKAAARRGLTQLATDLAYEKTGAYEAAATASEMGSDVLPWTHLTPGKNGFESPSAWATRRGRTDTGTPQFILDYEADVKPGFVEGLTGKLLLSGNKVATQTLGALGAAGIDSAGELAAKGSEAADTINRGLPDTGIVGAAVEELLPIGSQILTGRGFAAFGKGAAALGTFATAGAQSAGLTFAEEIAAGTPEDEARDKAAKAGLSTAIITSLFGTGVGGGVERAAVGGLSDDVTVGELLTMARERGIREVAKSPELRKFAGTVAGAAAGEGAEEGIDQLLGAFLTADPEDSLADAWDGAVQAFKVGAAIGGGIDVARNIVDNAPLSAQALLDDRTDGLPVAEGTDPELLPGTDGGPATLPEPVAPVASAAAEEAVAEPPGLAGEPAVPLTENFDSPADATPVPGSEPAASFPLPDVAETNTSAERVQETPENEQVGDPGIPEAVSGETTPETRQPGGELADLPMGTMVPGDTELPSGDPTTYSKANLASTFDLAPEQAEATDALVQSMGLDTSTIRLTRGGRPGEGLVLPQNPSSPQSIKGSFEILATGETLLRGLTNPDVSTAVHELAHVARTTLFDRATPVAGITSEDIEVAEQWAGAKDGVWNTAAEEKFARGFERYLRDGKAPTKTLEGVFQKIGNWLMGIYQSVAGSPIDVKISPAMRALFDRLVSRNLSPDETAQTEAPVAEPPDDIATDGPAPPAEVPAAPAAAGSPDEVTGLKHEIADADRERYGLPPRRKAPATTDQAAWDNAIAAEQAHTGPGTAGSNLLDTLLASPPRALTKDEHALLLHEKLRRQQAVDATYVVLNGIPATAERGVRGNAQKAMTQAQEAFDTLLIYADAAGSASGLSLQARKMLVAQDYSLATVLNRALAAKNKHSNTPQKLTDAEQKQAIELSEKLRATQDRVNSLTSENREQALLIEKLTQDIEKAMAAAQARDVKSRSKIKAKLAPLVEAAKARLAERGKYKFLAQEDGPLRSGLAPEDVQDIADLATVGAGWLVDKALDLQSFTIKLTQTFGDGVSALADHIFHKAKEIYHETAESVAGKASPTKQDVLDGIDPAAELDRSDVWALARAHVIAGVRGNKVLDMVFDDLSPVFPDLTRERVAVLFTNYGTVTYPSQDDVPKELNKIRSLERTTLKLADVLAKRLPKRTGFQRGEQDVDVRASEKEFREEYRKLEAELRAAGIEIEGDGQKLKTALAAAKRRMENEIEELQLAIDSKTPRVTSKGTVEYDPDAKRIKDRLDAKRLEYAAIFAPTKAEVVSEEQRVATRTAENWLKRLSTSQSDTLAWSLQAPVNPMAELLAAHLKESVADFQQQAEALGATPEQARVLDALIEGERQIASRIQDIRKQERESPERRAEMALKAIERQIAEEEQMARDGVLQKVKGEVVPDTAEITAARQRLSDLRQARRDLYEATHLGESALKQAKAATLKAIERLQEIVATGVIPSKSSGAPVTPDAELQALRDVKDTLADEVAEIRRALPKTAEQEARGLANALKQAQESLDRVSAKLAANDLSVKTGTPTSASRNAQIQGIRLISRLMNKELARRRREADTVRKSPEEARLHRQMASVKKRREELERRMREKDFTPKARPIPLNDPELRKAQFEFEKIKASYNEMLIEHAIKTANFSKKLGYQIRSSGNLLKVTTLGGDFGVLFRNLGGATMSTLTEDMRMLLPGRTGSKARADGSKFAALVKEGARAFGSRESEAAQYDAIMTRPNSAYDNLYGIKFASPFESGKVSTEDIPTANLIDKIPWWVWPAVAGVKIGLIASNPVVAAAVGLSAGKIAALIGVSTVQKPLLQALDRAQRAMTNHARATIMDAMIASMPDETLSTDDGKAFAKAVMVGTGRGAAKSLEGFMPALQTFTLAMRFYLSRVQALALYPLWSGPMSGDARKQIAGFYGKSVTGRAAIYTLLALAFGKADDDDPEDTGVVLNPWSKDFGKVRVTPELMVDVGSGLQQFAGMFYRAVRGGVQDKETGEIKVYTAQEKSQDLLRFLGTKRALTVGFLWDTWKGEYFGGKPATIETAIDEATSMIILNDMFQIAEQAGPGEAAMIYSLMLSGGGVQVGSFEKEKEKWAKLRGEKEREREEREARLNR